MARQQQLNIRRRSVVTYVGISEHGNCGYCKFTKRSNDKAKFAKTAAAAQSDASPCSPSPIDDNSTAVPTEANSAKAETEDDANNAQHVANDQDSSAADHNDSDGDGNGGNSAVFGLWAHQLTVQHYQRLADCGWRRSGRFLYKPLMDRTCCPQYTIRLDVHKFRLSRTQKRVLRAMRDFLRTDQRPKNGRAVVNDDGGETGQKNTSSMDKKGDGSGESGQPKQRKRKRHGSSSATTKTAQNQRTTMGNANDKTMGTTETNDDGQQQQGTTADDMTMTTNPIPLDAHGMERQPKKKTMRRRRAEERLKAHGIDLEQYKRQRAAREAARRRTIQSFLEGYNDPSWAHTFELRLIGQPSLELEEDFDEEFELFKRYQMEIHREKEVDQNPDSFRRFLASSPLCPGPSSASGRVPTMDNGEGQQQMQYGLPRHPNLGSYHQQYRLDGRLIAVAVIDLLPHCLSAKYFFYDPNYAFLSLGTYSALREIAFTQLLARYRPDLHFYYMGFYLYDCPKMRYKNRFRPSELLCDKCFNWVPVTECDRIIAANGGRFSTFHPSGESARAQLDNTQMDQIGCLYGDHPQLLTFASLRHSLLTAADAASSSADNQPEEDELEVNHGLYTIDGVSADADNQRNSPAALLHQLTNKVHTFAHHAGPTALEMVLILTD